MFAHALESEERVEREGVCMKREELVCEHDFQRVR